MKTSNEYSDKNPLRPEIKKHFKRTLDEAMVEIQEIINNTHWVETRLQELKANGYQIEECWVKNGSISTIWLMKRKQVYRIQVTPSELHGDYHKANCVVIPFSDLSIKISEQTKMRNIPISKNIRKEQEGFGK